MSTKEQTKTETKKVVKATREIYGVKLSTKLPNEVKATLKVIEANKGNKNVPFDKLYQQYVKEMSLISKSKSNLKTRFRRILYRNIEGILLKNSIQSAKFNLKANIKGIKIQTKSPIQYKANGDAVTSSVDTNEFSFILAKNITEVKEAKITASILERVNNFKANN